MSTENQIPSNHVMNTIQKEIVMTQQSPNSIAVPDAAQKRRERIKKLEARLQRKKARDTVATRRERNGQLFVWGAMVECVYRTGTDHERRQLREWAKRHLTEKRHLHRSECGFARIEEENAEKAADDAQDAREAATAPQPVPERQPSVSGDSAP
ncbi:MAG: hypothetical protein LUE17_08100 [Planctomycetaceae bacterium]|nr:hypothetical protein [Planctomycetaceae bacterium]